MLGISPIGVTDNFFDLGVTSLVAAQLFAAIEHELGGALPLGAIFRAPTIETLAELIESAANGSRWTSLVPIQPERHRPPIFCVHGGAGTILHLEPLARRLGADQPFYGLQSRGLYGGAPPLRTVEEMASHYLSEMRQVQPKGPWRSPATASAPSSPSRWPSACSPRARRCGWSRPSTARAPPGSGAGAGSAISPRSVAARSRCLSRSGTKFAGQSVSLSGFAVPSCTGRVLSTSPGRRRRSDLRVRVALGRGRALPEQLREQYFLRIHGVAERAYEPRPIPAEILVLYGERLYEDPALGWGGLALGGVKTFAVPGAHTSNRQVMRPPHVEFVRDRLLEYLDESSTDR